MSPCAQEFPYQYFAASAFAAATNYPLWRAAAIGQSGFKMASLNVAGVTVPQTLTPFVYGFLPPYKGMAATVIGMTWARAAIFYGSDTGREALLKAGFSSATATGLPPLILGTVVQVINQPIVRATVTLQNPKHHLPNVFQSLRYVRRKIKIFAATSMQEISIFLFHHLAFLLSFFLTYLLTLLLSTFLTLLLSTFLFRYLYQNHGVNALWLGTTAGVLKTVPKYMVAIGVKDFMEDYLAQPDPSSTTYDRDKLVRMAIKSASAGVAGAALTNPLDAIRNEQFKTHAGLRATVASLWKETGLKFMVRGIGKNIIAVAMPIGTTIFCTDLFIQMTLDKEKSAGMPMRGV